MRSWPQQVFSDVQLSPWFADGSYPKVLWINVFSNATEGFQAILIQIILYQHAIDLEVEVRVNLFNLWVPIAHVVSHDALLVLDVDVAAVLFEQQLGALNFVV